MLTVPLAPGLVVPVGVTEKRRVRPGETTEIEPASGSIALDGEREMEVGPKDRVEARLDTSGPLTIDPAVEASLIHADALAARIVLDPRSLDVIVGSNLLDDARSRGRRDDGRDHRGRNRGASRADRGGR